MACTPVGYQLTAKRSFCNGLFALLLLFDYCDSIGSVTSALDVFQEARARLAWVLSKQLGRYT